MILDRKVMKRLDKKIFDLKLAAKQLGKDAKKMKREEAKEINMCRKHVMRGDHVLGRVHAENAVRNHNQSLNLLSLEASLQGAVKVLQVASSQNKVTSAIDAVTRLITSATRSMNLPSLTIAMNQFQRVTDHLSVRQAYASEALQNEGGDMNVDMLMARIVDSVRLDIANGMPPAGNSVLDFTPSATDRSLDERLARLRDDHRSTE